MKENPNNDLKLHISKQNQNNINNNNNKNNNCNLDILEKNIYIKNDVNNDGNISYFLKFKFI